MVRTIRHKGLKRLHEEDDSRGVIGEHAVKLRDILARLDAARVVSDMDVPGFRLHSLTAYDVATPVQHASDHKQRS